MRAYNMNGIYFRGKITHVSHKLSSFIIVNPKRLWENASITMATLGRGESLARGRQRPARLTDETTHKRNWGILPYVLYYFFYIPWCTATVEIN